MLLSRLVACCLTVLVLAPFTAPFPTCDLAVILGGAQTQHTPASSAASLARDAGVANVPAISHIGRVRLLQAWHTHSSTVECAAATAASSRSARSPGGLRDTSILTTILRL